MWQIFYKYAALNLSLVRRSFLSEIEYRTSFVFKLLGVFTNNACFYLIWFMYFSRFTNVNGWGMRETALLLALATASYGWVLLFLRGLTSLASSISRGELDYYLSMPVNPLWLHAVSKTEITSLGEIIFSIFVVCLYPDFSFSFLLLYLLLVFFGGLIFISFLILSQSIAFYFPNFEDAAEQMWWSMVAFCWYPHSVFEGGLKLLTLTVFPAFFMCTLPVDIITNFSWFKLSLVAAFSLLSLKLAICFFETGLKRYESGNLIGVLR